MMMRCMTDSYCRRSMCCNSCFMTPHIRHDLAHTCNTLMRPTQLRPPRLGKEPCNANAEIFWQLIRSDRCLPLKEPPHTQFTPLDMIWIPRRPPSKHIPPHAALTQRPAARQRVKLIHKVPAPAPVAIPRFTRNTLRPHGYTAPVARRPCPAGAWYTAILDLLPAAAPIAVPIPGPSHRIQATLRQCDL